jgi:AraC-like DNA-binding protein
MYEEVAPPPPLRGVARCVWRSAAAAPKRIVPDGCLDLVVGATGAFVAGPDTTAWSSVTRPGEVLRGVRFTPGRAAAVLGVAADELRDRRVTLPELWGREGELLTERLLSGDLSPARAVVSLLPDTPPPDPAVAALVARLDAGATRVADVAGQVGVAERRLRRRFVQAIGYGPATYLRVSRFQRAVSLAPRAPGLAALAAAAGYADQAHLSRDVRALTGLTPRAYFPGRSTVDEVRSE